MLLVVRNFVVNQQNETCYSFVTQVSFFFFLFVSHIFSTMTTFLLWKSLVLVPRILLAESECLTHGPKGSKKFTCIVEYVALFLTCTIQYMIRKGYLFANVWLQSIWKIKQLYQIQIVHFIIFSWLLQQQKGAFFLKIKRLLSPAKVLPWLCVLLFFTNLSVAQAISIRGVHRIFY